MKSLYSFVVIEVAGKQALQACLNVVKRFNVPCTVMLRRSNPLLEELYAEMHFEVSDKPVPIRRQLGIMLAPSEIVVLLEDTTLPDNTLPIGLQGAFSDPDCAAAAGPITIGGGLNARFQALGCSEYGRYHPSAMQEGEGGQAAQAVSVPALPGNYICYRRDALLALLQDSGDGLIEGNINQQLLLQGKKLLLASKLGSIYCGKDYWGVRLLSRFHHGWIYAGRQADGETLGGRLLLFLKSMLLPGVLSLRAIRYMWRMDEVERPVVVGLWICAMELFWSAGEMVGSVLGKPRSMRHWR